MRELVWREAPGSRPEEWVAVALAFGHTAVALITTVPGERGLVWGVTTAEPMEADALAAQLRELASLIERAEDR